MDCRLVKDEGLPRSPLCVQNQNPPLPFTAQAICLAWLCGVPASTPGSSTLGAEATLRCGSFHQPSCQNRRSAPRFRALLSSDRYLVSLKLFIVACSALRSARMQASTGKPNVSRRRSVDTGSRLMPNSSSRRALTTKRDQRSVSKP